MNDFWQGFEKRAFFGKKMTREEKQRHQDARQQRALSDVEAYGALAGTGLGYKGITGATPKVTGQETVYHGTHPSNVQSIKERGLQPSFGGTATEAAKDDAQFIEGSRGRVHVTQEPSTARAYRDRTLTAGTDLASAPRPTLKEVLKPNKGGVLKAKIPFDHWDEHFERHPLYTSKSEVARTFKAVEPQHIVGGKGYSSTRWLKDLPAYMKKHPKRVLRGVAEGVGGIAALGGAGYLVHDAFKRRREAKRILAGGEKTAAESPLDWWLSEEHAAEEGNKVKPTIRQDAREASEWRGPETWFRGWP